LTARLDVNMAEPFIDDDLSFGFALIDSNSMIEIHLMDEWRVIDNELAKKLDARIDNYNSVFHFPARPQLDEDDPHLHRDLVRFLAEHIWFPDDRYYSLLANWIIASYIMEFNHHATRLILTGPTNSGKSRAIKCLTLLSYRGFNNVMPTGPGLFRMIERFHITICLDELQDIRGERREDIDQVIKGGFESGTGVIRCDEKGDVDIFKVFSPMAIGTKRPPKEDIENRSVLITMMQKPPDDELKDIKIRRRIDEVAARSLRGRLLALRLKALARKIDIEELTRQACEIAEQGIMIEGKEIFLNDRSIDKAIQLLVPGLIFNDYDDTLSLLARSEKDADQGLNETIEARTFYALQAFQNDSWRSCLSGIAKNDISKITTRDIADQLNQDLIENEDDHDRIRTETVGRILRVLGFRFKKGHGRASYFDPQNFDEIYRANFRKYGMRSGDEAER
jgi:hypothetical protein